MGQNNIIELNGKQYDAITGAFLGESKVKATPASRVRAQQHRGRTIDGFMRGSKPSNLAPVVVRPAPQVKSQTKPVAAPIKNAGVGKKMDIKRMPQKSLNAHQPQRPKTLMRHVVNKPKAELKPAIKTTVPSEMMAKPTSTLAKQLEKKMSVTQVNPVRLARSKHIAKSHHIRRYHQDKSAVIPAAQARAQSIARPARTDYHIPVAAQPQRTAIAQPASAGTQPVQGQQKQTAADIFEAALAHATSHQELAPKHIAKRHTAYRRRLVNITAGIAAFLIIGGFLAYLNMPAIELRVASIRAGFHAQMPNYQPMGYAMDGDIKSSEGKVEMKFRSGDSSYKITQTASDWNSATLLDANAEKQGTPTQTIQSKGRIIYIYDDKNVTWVNGGVRYEITSNNAALDTDELVSLATSM